MFQSTLPRRERHHESIAVAWGYHGFNPRSREGSDCFFIGCLLICGVSIHAPAKGATPLSVYFDAVSFVFQSTLPRRERPSSGIWSRSFLLFQSTLPRRERQDQALIVFNEIVFQSTLPRRERPLAKLARTGASSGFNPRSREGSDGLMRIFSPCLRLFQSTLPRRERRERCRGFLPWGVSIHAPAKGATKGGSRRSRRTTVSIHAPAKGATASDWKD